MAVRFTTSQRAAIDTHGRTLLISAAAGSGKTATLTERIISELTNKEHPADISRMLIVTFTRAAAGELRTRISAALSAALNDDPDNAHLSNQLVAVAGARICTIDAFYLDVVRENFNRLGISASLRLADAGELLAMQRECMQRTIDDMIVSDPDISQLACSLTTARGDQRLAEVLIGFAARLDSMPRGRHTPADEAARLDCEAEGEFIESRAGKCAVDLIYDKLEDVRRTLEGIHSEVAWDESYPAKYAAVIESDIETIGRLLGAVNAADETALRRGFEEFDLARLPAFKRGTKTPRADEIAKFRTEMKRQIRETGRRYFAMSPDEIRTAQRDTARLLRALSRILLRYGEQLDGEKKARGVCDFADIRRYAHALLISPDGQPTELALEWRERFTEIFVDEYQDTDSVQDEIFRAISNGRDLFMVGDIKQSIYAFRGAEPSIFADYRRRFETIDPTAGQDGESTAPGAIYMSENFRCARSIVDFANAVSSYLFSVSEDSPRPHGIGYRAEDDLIFARGDDGGAPAEVVLIENADSDAKEEAQNAADDGATTGNGNDDDNDGAAGDNDAEVRYVSSRIAEMIAAGEDPGSIAVLSRSKSFAAGVVRALTTLGIPAANSVGEDLFADPEVLMFVSLLSAVDNPQRDIPLAGALRSPVFGLTLSDMVKIKTSGEHISLFDALTSYADEGRDDELKAKCRSTLARLADWRAYAEAMPADKLIRRIYADTTALMYSGADSSRSDLSPATRRANLRRLYEYARRFEGSTFRGLSEFVTYINGMISDGVKIESDASSARGAVSVMTIHKSKGLEFPTVFIVGLGSRFNRRDAAQDLCYSPDAGMGMRLAGADGLTKLDTPMRHAVAEHEAALSAEEELRVLYVALTRAKERLIITAKCGRGGSDGLLYDAARRAERGGRASVLTAPSSIVHILTALHGKKTDDFCRISVSKGANYKNATPADSVQDSNDAAIDTHKLAEQLRRRIEYRYPHAHISALPAKLSVSRLSPSALDDDMQALPTLSDTTSFGLQAPLTANKVDTDTDAHAYTEAHGNGMVEATEPRRTRVPSFMMKDGDKDEADEARTAAQKGTATHLFLQFCNFTALDGTAAAIDREAERMQALGFISSRDAELLRRDELRTFSNSRLFEEIKKAPKLYREQRFNIYLPAERFTTDEAIARELVGERILVQGVIDLFFTDTRNRLVLCDYKTDRLSRREIADPTLAARRLCATHSEQLAYYAAALEAIAGHRPDRVLIYSLALGDSIEVPLW